MGKLFSEKKKKLAGVFQVSILNPILFLIYISNLPVGTKSIYNDLKIISNWAIQWKMLFNPDPI